MMVDGLAEPSLRAAFSARYSAYETMLFSDNTKEGSRAFLEHRKPVWKNR